MIASGDLHLDTDDCDSCGTVVNRLQYTWDGNWIHLTASVGCDDSYSKFMDTEADVRDWAQDFTRRFPSAADDIADLAEDFDALLAQASSAAYDDVAAYDDDDVMA